jgi:hypothetical protein
LYTWSIIWTTLDSVTNIMPAKFIESSHLHTQTKDVRVIDQSIIKVYKILSNSYQTCTPNNQTYVLQIL